MEPRRPSLKRRSYARVTSNNIPPRLTRDLGLPTQRRWGILAKKSKSASTQIEAANLPLSKRARRPATKLRSAILPQSGQGSPSLSRGERGAERSEGSGISEAARWAAERRKKLGGGAVTRLRKKSEIDYLPPNAFLSSSAATWGLALPWVSAMTWPTKNCRTGVLPA